MQKNEFIRQEWKTFIWITAGGILLFFAVLLWKYLPILQVLHQPCAFQQLLHIYCPGCGGTRAVYSLLRFRLWESFLEHPVVLFTALVGTEYYIGAIITLIRNNGKRYYYVRVWFCYVALGIIVVNFILKNLLLIVFHYDYMQDLIQYWI